MHGQAAGGGAPQPVAICTLKRVAADYKEDVTARLPRPAPSNGKRIACVGAGPASLTVVPSESAGTRSCRHSAAMVTVAAKPAGGREDDLDRIDCDSRDASLARWPARVRAQASRSRYSRSSVSSSSTLRVASICAPTLLYQYLALERSPSMRWTSP